MILYIDPLKHFIVVTQILFSTETYILTSRYAQWQADVEKVNPHSHSDTVILEDDKQHCCHWPSLNKSWRTTNKI